MNDYVIITDSACDIKPNVLEKWGVPCIGLIFRFSDNDMELSDHDMPAKEFYAKMREGGIAKTAAINMDTFRTEFEKILKEGKDVLYLGFSSGLSTTYNSARITATELQEEYPNQKIIVVDSLSASAGYGLLLHLTVNKKAEGASIEETAAYAKELIPHLCHWFTVDDLVYLKRGGRVSATTALVGGMLNIKPVLHMDNEGHLINMSKVRGRKAAITALADKYTELAQDPQNGTVFISHGDCIDDAKMLESILHDRHGAQVNIITDIGPVIGAHSGPGTLALFFVGKER